MTRSPTVFSPARERRAHRLFSFLLLLLFARLHKLNFRDSGASNALCSSSWRTKSSPPTLPTRSLPLPATNSPPSLSTALPTRAITAAISPTATDSNPATAQATTRPVHQTMASQRFPAPRARQTMRGEGKATTSEGGSPASSSPTTLAIRCVSSLQQTPNLDSSASHNRSPSLR